MAHNINTRGERSGSCVQFSLLLHFTLALQRLFNPFLCLHFTLIVPTSFLIPPYCLTVLLALWNLATLAMFSAAKALRSLTDESRIFTMLCRPPMSTMTRRICTLWLIFLRIFRDPIWNHTHMHYKLSHILSRLIRYFKKLKICFMENKSVMSYANIRLPSALSIHVVIPSRQTFTHISTKNRQDRTL